MPQPFGTEHIIYLVVSLGLTAAALFLIKRYVKSLRNIDLAVKLSGVLLLLCVLWNRLSVCVYSDAWTNPANYVCGRFNELLPGTFCGTSSIVLALTAIFGKRDNRVLHCVAYTALLGAVLTVIYPDFIGQADSIFFSKTISGLLHHSVSLFVVLLLLLTGWLKPALKKWALLPLGLCVYMTYGVFLLSVWGREDAMYIHNSVLEGTIFNWFVIGILFLILHALALTVYELIKEHRLKTEA